MLIFVFAVSPVVTVTSPSSVVILEEMLVLSCDVQGDPQPGFQWSSPPGANAIVDSTQLTIPSAAPENTGSYTCTAINPQGTGSDTILISVRGRAVARLLGI